MISFKAIKVKILEKLGFGTCPNSECIVYVSSELEEVGCGLGVF